MAKKKTVKMKATKVWCVVGPKGNVLWMIFGSYAKISGVFKKELFCRNERVVGPITLREPRTRKGKR